MKDEKAAIRRELHKRMRIRNLLRLSAATHTLRGLMMGSLHGIHPMRWDIDLAEELAEKFSQALGSDTWGLDDNDEVVEGGYTTQEILFPDSNG